MSDKTAIRDRQSAPAFMSPGMAFNIWGPALACNAGWNAKFYESFATLSDEWQGFLSRRMKEDMSLFQAMGGSQSPEQAWSAYAEFWQKAAKDYAQEFTVMSKLTGDFMNSSIGTMDRSMEEATSQVPALTKAA